MRILLYQWKAYSGTLLEKNLLKIGHSVCAWKNDDIMYGEESSIEVMLKKLQEGFDVVFSYNYFKMIALACKQADVPYVSWMQDAPMLNLYDMSSVFETNYFFCFDSEQYRNLMQRGLPHVYYMPLAVDRDFFDSMIASTSGEEQKLYRTDVSFVGALYTRNDMYGMIEKTVHPYARGYLSAFCKMQLLVPPLRFSEMEINRECRQILEKQIHFPDFGNYELTFDELLDNLLDRHVTVMERQEMLRICSSIPNFKLYTNAETPEFPEITNMGSVDYYTQMPKVFRYSKINLNLSLRSIRYGIPLRVLDVIASGGFVLTNAQPDLFLYFEEGKNIVTFQSPAEMKDKIHYYLQHEDERLEIIRAGQEVINREFDFGVLLPKIFSVF